MGYAFTPSDVYGGAHIMFVILGYPATSFMAIIYSIVIFINKEYPNRYALIFIIFSLIWFIYIAFMLTTSPLTIRITWQKIGKYARKICLIIEGYGAWKLEKSKSL